MKYIECETGEDNAFAQYGTLVHSLLQDYSNGKLDTFDLATEYENRFDNDITAEFPYNKYADLRESYFYKGLDYFESFDGIMDCDYDILGVEMKVEFEIAGKPFVGFIDLLARDSDDKIIFLDHKSATLKWKKNGEVTKGDAEKLHMYKRQQYLYCKALIDKGVQPDYLCWNFFNDGGRLYKIPFDENEYQEALQWAEDTIKEIEACEEFEPKEDYYFCHNICDMRMKCPLGQPEVRPDDVEWEVGI